MKRQLLFVQGGGAGVHDEWDDKLVASLERELGPDYPVRYPRMPDEDDPRYASWKAALENELGKLPDGSLLIGHSIGATVLINVLAEHRTRWAPGGVFLISPPFVGEGGWPSEDIEPMSDLEARLTARAPVYVYFGSKDDTVPPEHVGLIEKALPSAVMRRLAGRDHQLDNDLSEVAADVRRLASVSHR